MINKWIKHIARLSLPVYLYESDNMRIAYAGYSAIKRNYYARMVLNNNQNETYIGRLMFWQLKRLFKSSNLDLVISETSRISLNHFQTYGGYIIPEWVEMRINIDRPLQEICRESVSDFARVARRIRKFNLSYEMLSDDESFNYFYNRMYLPYISKRHGEEALIEDLNLFWKSSPSPLLIFIEENGIIVGGSLIKKNGDSLKGIRLGLLDGNDEYMRHGVIGAIYYFCVIEGQKMGCKYLDIGGSRPFLNDGLTKYKLGLSAEFAIESSPWKEYLWLGVKDGSIAANEFLQNNPFMHLSKDNLYKSSMS
jgi:hypothetical protein